MKITFMFKEIQMPQNILNYFPGMLGLHDLDKGSYFLYLFRKNKLTDMFTQGLLPELVHSSFLL